MDPNKKYITQITKHDLKELADVANVYPGDGIDISRNEDGLMISVDRSQLTRWIKTIVAGGNI